MKWLTPREETACQSSSITGGPFLQIVAVLLLLTACTFIIAPPKTDESAKYFAYTTVGALMCIIWSQCRHPQCGHKH